MHAMNMPARQSGNVLIVVVLLLALAGIMALFGLNTGVFEQRASGNDMKAKTASEIAEAGLAQGVEFIHQHYSYITDTTKWTACLATDTSFPCGSVPASRRGTMYRWSGGGYDFDGNGTISGWETRMLPIPATNVVTSAGNGFGVRYGVGAVLCRAAFKASTTAPTTCTDSGSASATSVLTFVSVATLPGESARSTMAQSVGSYNLLNSAVNVPPILASGSVDLTGTLQIVTNPNAGGTGVPVSVWTRKDVSKTGTPNTCYYNEFLHNSSGSANGTVYADASSPNFPLCDNCDCSGADSLSYDAAGNKQTKGIDILDGTGGGANSAVAASEFPCDLFQQVFGVQAWSDSDGDNFCDTKIMTTYQNPNTQVNVTMGVDEAYLFQNAGTIIPSAATTAANLATAAQLVQPGTYPSSAYSGLVWCQTNCGIGSNQQIGSAASPVLLVIDGNATIQGKVFGLVFVRSLAGGATLTPSTGYAMSATEVTNGGNVSLSMNAGAVVYGSLVVQGQVQKANGTSSVVYNGDIFTNLLNSPGLVKFGGVPGAWTDRTSY
jgi:hypothetical protein